MYQLVDFGNGRKLEQFPGCLINRPCPVAIGTPIAAGAADRWNQADARFELRKEHKGSWAFSNRPPEPWLLPTVFGEMELFTTDFGHLGVFVEQQMNWQWLSRLPLSGMKLLNLFAYTGGSTLAAAAAGAVVTHVDSAKNIVRRASENCRISNLQEKTIRWIVEDARKFVHREAKRGNRYDGVIFDPPSYGHGATAGSIWKIEEHLGDLIDGLKTIVPACRLMLFTCHSDGYTPGHMKHLVNRFTSGTAENGSQIESGPMNLQSIDGRLLNSGNFIRWFEESA